MCSGLDACGWSKVGPPRGVRARVRLRVSTSNPNPNPNPNPYPSKVGCAWRSAGTASPLAHNKLIALRRPEGWTRAFVAIEVRGSRP